MIKTGQTIAATDFIIATTAGEALSARDACYIDDSDGKAYKCDSDDLTKIEFVGFAQEAAALNAAVNLINDNVATGFSGLTIGGDVYLSATAGAVTQTPPTNEVAVGFAVSASVIKIKPITRTTGVQVFTADGTWTKRAGLKYVIVEAVGAGGGGGGADTDDSGQVGSGGGGGGYCRKLIPAASLSATETVTVGVAGVHGTTGSSPTSGTAGENTTFGSHFTAGGGGGGVGDAGSGGSAGSASGGDLNIPGEAGDGGDTLNGVYISAGNSVLGTGGARKSSTTKAASGYGGGGYGGADNGAASGSPGTDGIVIVYEYY